MQNEVPSRPQASRTPLIIPLLYSFKDTGETEERGGGGACLTYTCCVCGKTSGEVCLLSLCLIWDYLEFRPICLLTTNRVIPFPLCIIQGGGRKRIITSRINRIKKEKEYPMQRVHRCTHPTQPHPTPSTHPLTPTHPPILTYSTSGYDVTHCHKPALTHAHRAEISSCQASTLPEAVSPAPSSSSSEETSR